jgi:hypothetical protein
MRRSKAAGRWATARRGHFVNAGNVLEIIGDLRARQAAAESPGDSPAAR